MPFCSLERGQDVPPKLLLKLLVPALIPEPPFDQVEHESGVGVVVMDPPLHLLLGAVGSPVVTCAVMSHPAETQSRAAHANTPQHTHTQLGMAMHTEQPVAGFPDNFKLIVENSTTCTPQPAESTTAHTEQ